MRPPCSREALLADLRRVYTLTRSTTSHVYQALGSHSVSSVYAHFPSWRAFVEAAGLPLPWQTRGVPRDRLSPPASSSHTDELGPSGRELWRATRARRAVRTCLRCERRFLSDGPHNRRCRLCTLELQRGGAVAYDEWGV